jgi:hypothetical protein
VVYLNDGLDIGETLATPLFCAAFAPPLDKARVAHPTLTFQSFADDIVVSTLDEAELAPGIQTLDAELLAGPRLRRQPSKSVAFAQTEAQRQAAIAAGVDPARVSDAGLTLYGVPVGTDEYVTTGCEEVAAAALALLSQLTDVIDGKRTLPPAELQAACHFLRLCVSSKMVHLLRCVPWELCGGAAGRVDGALDTWLRLLFGVEEDIVDPVARVGWERVHLPVNRGGLGYARLQWRADAAFAAATAAASPWVRTALPEATEVVAAPQPPAIAAAAAAAAAAAMAAAQAAVLAGQPPPPPPPPPLPPHMVPQATEVMVGPHYHAVMARLEATGAVKQSHLDALSLRALAVANPGRRLQQAITKPLLDKYAADWKEEALLQAQGSDFPDHDAAWARSSSVPQPVFGAFVGNRKARVSNEFWVTMGRLLTRQPVLTRGAVGHPVPRDPNGYILCPYESCQLPIPASGEHACGSIAQSVARHDAVRDALAEVAKAAAGPHLLVQREPHLRDDQQHFGGLKANAPKTDLRADLLIANHEGNRLYADIAFANPSSNKHISAAAAVDGGAAATAAADKRKHYSVFFNNPNGPHGIRPLIVETWGRVVDHGFFASAARMAVGAVAPGAGGAAYARVLRELRLRTSVVVWRFAALHAHRLVKAVARQVAGGGDFLPPVGVGGLGGGLGVPGGE